MQYVMHRNIIRAMIIIHALNFFNHKFEKKNGTSHKQLNFGYYLYVKILIIGKHDWAFNTPNAWLTEGATF